jgi:PAS domain S-box-containing protein
MKRELKVLMLEDSPADARMAERTLRRAGLAFSALRVVDEAGFRRALDDSPPDLILADYSLPSFDGLSALAIARAECPAAQFILLSGTLLEERAIDALRDGATDYVLKQRMERLGPAVLRALADAEEREGHRAAEVALRASEERLALAVQAGGVGIWDWNLRSGVTYYSPEWKAILGCEEGEVSPSFEAWASRVHPEDLERVRGLVDACVAGATPAYESEYRLRHRDGSYRWIVSRGSCYADAEGRPCRMAGTHIDITERKSNELRREIEHSVSRILARAPAREEGSREILQVVCQSLGWEAAGLWSLDPAGTRLRCDHVWYCPGTGLEAFEVASLGMTLEAGHGLPGRVWASGQPAWIADLNADRNFPSHGSIAGSGIQAALAFPLASDGSVRGVIEFLTRDTQPPDVDLLRTLGSVVSQLGQFIERKRAEEALAESEARLSHLVSATPAVIYSLRVAEGNWLVPTWMSEHLERILGYRPERVTGPEWWWDRIHPDERDALEVDLHRLFVDDHLVQDYRFRHHDGTYRWIRDEKMLFRDEQGRPVEAIGSWIDITSRKETEDALQRSNERLVETLDELRRAQSRIIEQERLRVLGQMAGGIAHDFNNALSPIVGFSDLLLMRPEILSDREKTLTYLGMMNTAARDAASVVRRLRESYRPRSLQDVTGPVDLNALLVQVVDLTRPRWRDQAMARAVNIAVRVLPGKIPMVAGDDSHLREALTNLIFNAVDAMPEGGTLTLSTALMEDLPGGLRPANGHSGSGPAKRIRLEVSDTGTGMPEDVRQHCLEPFFSSKGEEGTGLGLSMVYGIVERHDGTLEIRSAPGEGTTVSITLPAYNHEAARAAAPEPPASLRGLRVLVIDDEDMVRRVTSALLNACGHSVTSFDNAADGLLALAAERFDVLVTDRAMPRMNGDQLALAAKQLAPDVPVILLTGFGDLMDTRDERAPGVDLVVSKPLTLAALQEALRAVVPGKAFAPDQRAPLGASESRRMPDEREKCVL